MVTSHQRQWAKKARAITDKPLEETEGDRWEDARANMQDGVKDREVVTPLRKNVKEVVEEMSKGIRKALPTKFPPTMRLGDEVM